MIFTTKFNKMASKNTNSKITGEMELNDHQDWVKYVIPEKYFEQQVKRSDYEYDYQYKRALDNIKNNLDIDGKIQEKFKSYRLR